MQIDDPKRGFSFREEGPLDLRLNQQAGVPASERLKEMDAEEIEGMLFENSDEPLARELARAIMSAKRKKQPIETTSELREIVEQVVLRTKPENPKEAVKKTCQRVQNQAFQPFFQSHQYLQNSSNKHPILSRHNPDLSDASLFFLTQSDQHQVSTNGLHPKTVKNLLCMTSIAKCCVNTDLAWLHI